MLASRFIYDLTGQPRPSDTELDEEIDRLLYIKTTEQPDYLTVQESRDQLANLDSEILSLWLTKKFKTALMLLLVENNNNYFQAKAELFKMERYNNSLVDRFLRASFLHRHAMKRVKEIYFADEQIPSLEHTITDLKRALTFLSQHLEQESPEYCTLLNTDRFNLADVTLYNFLKRLVTGKYKDLGLESHVKLCAPLVRFMRRYASKNTHIIDISSGDPLADDKRESSLLADVVIPATVGVGAIMFYLWCRRR